MPYVTEDIHTSMHSSSIMNEKYPSYKGQWDVWYDPSSEEEFNSAVVEPTRAVRSIRKLAADVFGKESASASYVRMSVISAETTMVSHDTQNNHSQKDDTARSFSELLASNIEHVRQLSRHQNIEVAAGDGNDDDGDDDAPCLSRRLVMPNNASVVVRVYLPLLTGGGDENGNAIGDAHASINKELKLLRGRQKKVNKQLKKLKILTERSTYVQEAPPEIQLQHALKIAELEADTLDIDATMKILSDFESSSIL
jgi:valyl-tRNA synthetase